MLGYAGLAVGPPDEAWVQNIAVRRDAQRRGIGRALLEALLAEAGRHGVPAGAAGGGGRQRAGPAAVRRLRVRAVGVRRGYYQPSNTDALVMRDG